jgi:diacylglycerol kinase (ATP)
MRLGVIINPVSGGNRGKEIGPRVLSRLQETDHEVFNLSGENLQEAKAKGKAAVDSKEIDVLIVVGGDGMAHLGVNLCAERDVPLAIVPAGTGNDSAMMLGMELGDPIKSLELILQNLSSPKKIDALSIVHRDKHTWAIGTASAGFDALVNARANRMNWPKGPNRYYAAMLLELASFKPVKYNIVVDGQERVFEAMLCIVSNSGVFGGGMKVVPDASVTDQKLDLLMLKKMSRLKLLAIFPKVYKGEHVTEPEVEIIRASQVTIRAEGMPIYSDGEYVGRAPFRATLVPACLSVIAAKAL